MKANTWFSITAANKYNPIEKNVIKFNIVEYGASLLSGKGCVNGRKTSGTTFKIISSYK